MITTEHDQRWMRRALELAHRGAGWTAPNPMVGAVIVKDGEGVGEGFHPRLGEPHAEVFALREAGDRARGATAYVTLEPCNHRGRTGPCTQALIDAGVARVVFAVEDPNPLTASQAVSVLTAAGVEVAWGLCADEARRLNEVFFKHVRTRLPFVVMKMAMTMDGKIATETGESKWISGPVSREYVQALRAELSVVMVGIKTVLADDPRLDARLEGAHQPTRVIVDPRAETPLDARLFSIESPLLIAVGPEAPAARRAALEARGAEVVATPALPNGHLDLAWLMAELGRRDLSGVLLEGGGGLNASALAQGVVDKLVYFVAPKLIGGTQSPTPIEGEGIKAMADARALYDLRAYPSGDDVRLEAYLNPSS
ncbi:bifunctional diaminohydroxyphosphoribosylaminopyrimidine deaminase/5-amino-6-(5-phosphoribosylamino)uracil reductase RibD [bacterium]|nr:bifunctional diaminohydroxyphosphoribosylaminopyrimidine deaminase/5-amino-6-(5-phosphoribosylamino)uracil reductase RibD [bacterium]